jgi:cytochrome c-type biogenesis protein CcmH
MIFWILAAVGLAIATFIACLPLFRPKTGWTPVALALVFALPAGALMLYQDVGTPQALNIVVTPATHAAQSDEIEDMAANLRSRLTANPESLDGWMLLARTLKTMQRYPEALDALETANRIAPENPSVMVELVEAHIFVSAQGRITDEMVTMLREALTRDPGQQKALWLMGIAATQAGEDEAAISYWENLLQQLEPGSPSAPSVQEQIAAAQGRLGLETEIVTKQEEEQAAASTGWPGIMLSLSPGDALLAEMPSASVLYVMIRRPGPAVGPPMGVRRVSNPALPLELVISDKDSMLEELQISSLPEVQLQARLSLSGSPQARAGDWQSNSVAVSLNSTDTVKLVIDQRVE